jgi:uncharacterized membrane protein
MVWFIFALLGAFFDATSNALTKKILKDVNPYVLGSGVFLTGSIILLIVSLVIGIPTIGPGFYFAVLATVFLNIISIIIFYKALMITDLSLAIPMLAFTPVFLIFTSFIMLGESPTVFGLIGILLVVIGYYVLNLDRKKGWSASFKGLLKNKGMVLMLIVAFLFSISSNFDKLVVTNSDAFFGSAIDGLLMGIFFLVFSVIKKQKIIAVYKKNLFSFVLLAGLAGLTTVLINFAYLTQIVPYVNSLKRVSILFTIFYGGLMFKEKDMIKRSIGALIMLLGVILIIIL